MSRKHPRNHVILCHTENEMHEVLEILHKDSNYEESHRGLLDQCSIDSMLRYVARGAVYIYVTNDGLTYSNRGYFESVPNASEKYGHLFTAYAWLCAQSGHHGTVVYPEHYMPALCDEAAEEAAVNYTAQSNNSEVLLLL